MAYLIHYGTPRHSGRYPWGSGEDPYQRSGGFLSRVKELEKSGMSEREIAESLGMNTAQLRIKKSTAKDAQRMADSAEAFRLKEKGWSNVSIGERMGIPESSVRNLLRESTKVKAELTQNTADALKRSVSENGYVDVGVGVERHMGISREKLKTAISQLTDEGYGIHYVNVEQLGTGQKTTVMVLAKPGATYSDVYKNRFDIKPPIEYTEDGAKTYVKLEKPRSVDSSRLDIRYAEDGGTQRDGLIELRRGVDDISLGNASYAQVRIAVDGSHYLKGMAMYSDDLPPGVDIRFNTNKSNTGNKLDALKKMKDDPANPFGATIKPEESLRLAQRHYVDKDGKKQQSCINVVNEEGDWNKWSKTLSSQFLSKQDTSLIKSQLDLAYKQRKEEYDEIMGLTNDAVKKKLLQEFADQCDSDAVHLKGAALPRQSSKVILPVPEMKDTEIYAPSYKNGEKVCLVRYPHGGTFEIPELTVNNKNPKAKSLLGNALDAVGINGKVAERLSGADFDGDTVIVIPNDQGKVKHSPSLDGLKNFDPKTAYPKYDGMTVLSEKGKQLKMGDVSNLITDMTIKGARQDEIAAAVRHSMVVIDAVKHELNYKQSYIDNGIANLKKKYQGSERSGASTLISRASSESRPGARKEGVLVTDPKTGKTKRVYIDPKTGKKLYEYTGETYTNKKGQIVKRTTTSTKMYETDDARKLSSGSKVEGIYAKFANDMKALGNQTRLDLLNTPSVKQNPSASKTYKAEVDSLKTKLDTAKKNAPLERRAQILANSILKAKKEANPDLVSDPAALKKAKGQALTEARKRVGAGKEAIDITPREWEAIQAGALSNQAVTDILNNAKPDQVKSYASPRKNKGLSPSKQARAKAMLASGYTQAEVAEALGVSTSTVADIIK